MKKVYRIFEIRERVNFRIIAIALITILTLLLSCKSKGALTPEEAFKSLTSAYSKSDVEAVVKLLSLGSKEKIRKIIKMIASMNDTQLTSLSERFGVSVEKMKNLTVRDYMSIQLAIGKKLGGDIIIESNKYSIVGIDVKGERANVRVENGMELSFVKEGPYWKFDMEDL